MRFLENIEINLTARGVNFAQVVLALTLSILSGCIPIKDRIKIAERDGRTVDAFWLSVDYYDSDRAVEAREALERNANIYFDRLLQISESHIRNNNFSAAFNILDGSGRDAAPTALDAADRRNVKITRRDELPRIRAIANTRLDDYYAEAMSLYSQGDFSAALFRFNQMQGIRESDRYGEICKNELRYSEASAEFNAGNFRKAYIAFGKLPPDFKDAAAKRRTSFDRAKLTVKIYNFDGDNDKKLKNSIALELSDEPFIEVIQINGRFEGATGDIAKNVNDMLAITGSITSQLSGPSFRLIEKQPDAWIITGETQEIIKKDGAKFYARLAKPLIYSVSEAFSSAHVNIDCSILDGYALRSIHSTARDANRYDSCLYYSSTSVYSPELFTLRNPAGDSLNYPISAWKPSASDKHFQRNFLEKRKPADPSVLLGSALDDVRFDIAREIRRVISERLAKF